MTNTRTKRIKGLSKGRIWTEDRSALLDLCLQKREQGYDSVASGGGPYVEKWEGRDEKVFSPYKPLSVRIVDLLAFFRPDGNVSTREYPKIVEPVDGMGMHLIRFEGEYTPADFERHIAHYKIKMDKRFSLGGSLR